MLLGALLTPFLASAAETKTVTLDVPGMTCKFCPITIRKALEKVPGVIDAKSDYETKSATVTFDPDKTNIEALTKATENAGYPSVLKK
ncbi:MAG: mercury resistance system periplasmic binding protein MerP [Gammaproteobacteria bacterium]|nr:mercury resistance system periplasmic binding protein MerP [Gammaproteobacteria bacterium]MCW9031842.1 mercury resistance system periplasmic binding protein MerP [Gammaproteobacteria bacterium]